MMNNVHGIIFFNCFHFFNTKPAIINVFYFKTILLTIFFFNEYMSMAKTLL